MGKLATAAATSQRLSLVASEEALLSGREEKDISDILLALLSDPGRAGAALREAGITLTAARAAATPDGARREADALRDRPALDAAIRAAWSQRAQAVISAASSSGRAGDSAAVLRELAAEPSGEIAGLLARLGIVPAELLTRLDGTPEAPVEEVALPPSATAIAGWGVEVVAAGAERAWELLANPARMPEWLEEIADVNIADGVDGRRAGAGWEATTRADGPVARRRGATWRRQRIDLLTVEEPTEIAWRFSWPEAPGANSRCLAISLRPVTGGTRLGIGVGWERRAGRAPGAVRRRLLRRVWGLAVHNQVMSIGGSIRRALDPASPAGED